MTKEGKKAIELFKKWRKEGMIDSDEKLQEMIDRVKEKVAK